MKYKQNTRNLSIYTAIVFACVFSGSCGTLGGFDNRVFPTSMKNLEKAIDTLYAKYPAYKIPDKWKKYDDWKKSGYGFLETRIFYLDSSSLPEEMYYVSFIGDPPDENPDKAVIAIRAVDRGIDRWYKEENFGSEEREIIEHRFDTAIVAKLEKYTHTKAERESSY